MSQPPSDESNVKPSKVGADAVATAAGSGTFIFVIAQTLPEPYKLWLSAASPTISAASVGLWVILRHQIGKKWRETEMRRAIGKAKRTYRRALKSKTASEPHKEKLRKNLEALELLESQADFDIAKGLIKKRVKEHVE